MRRFKRYITKFISYGILNMYNRIISTNQFQTTLTSGITSSPTGTFTIGTTSSTGYGSFSLPTGTGNPRVQNESTVPYYFWATVNYGNPTEEVFRISQVSTSGGTITLTYDQRIGQATLNAHVT